ncbi:MAG: type II and III secretion system protein family protein [Roseovarius sp.]|nr:type II and III secretion system protein family protein [Roseovarius sp.]
MLKRTREAGGDWRGGVILLMLIALAMAVLPGNRAAAQDRYIVLGAGGQREPIVLGPGFTMTMEIDKPFVDILVGNPGVAEIFPLSDRTFYVEGKQSGATNVVFLDANNRQLGTIVLRVQGDFGEIQRALERAVPSASVTVTNVNNRIRLSGTVRDNADKLRVLEIAEQYSEEPVIDAIRVTTPQQVQLDVRILEVSRNAGRALGVNLIATRNGRITGVTGGDAGTNVVPFGTFVGQLLEVAGLEIDFIINALEDKGLARRLANPTLVTSNGVEANFVVGGEVPIATAVTAENGTVATETDYREYGVRLNFRPQILDDSLISLRIRPEVSDIDTSFTVNGEPAFISRKADTTVSLRDGQSFAIAGLLQVDNERAVRQLPWLGQIPVLGALFRSSAFQKSETDLVILVTPRLVQPGTPDQPLSSPLDNARPSDDVELFLLGMLEVNKDMIRGFEEGRGVIGPVGHLINLEFDDAIIAKK